MKKTLTKLLAGALALSMMAVPAFAAAGSTLADQAVTGTTVPAPILVEIKGTPKVIVNPYKLNVKISDASVADAAAGDGSTAADPIISVPFYVVNTGKTALEVSATVTGTTDSDKTKAVTFATASFANSTKPVTAKQVFLFSRSGLATADNGSGDPTWTGEYDKTKDQVITAATSKPAVLFTLAENMASGQSATKSNIGAVKLLGEANGNAAQAWAAENTVSVTYAFTLRPCILPSA